MKPKHTTDFGVSLVTDIILRDYQSTDIQRLRNAYSHGMRAPIYQLSTGGGKTVVFSHVVKSAVTKGRRILILAHRRELIRQASAKLNDLGVAHGIIAAGQDRDHDAQVIVASIQTVARRLDSLPKFDLIVIDEAHHAVASTWSALLESQPQAKILGVTATPARLDGKGLGKHCGGHFDAIVNGPSMQDLVDQGWLAPCKVFIPHATINVDGIGKVAGDYNEGQLEARAMAVNGDAVAEFKKLPEGTTAIVFCVTVRHAEKLADDFVAAGFRAATVHGGLTKERRDANIAGLGDGSVQVLTSCEIISEGLDVPSVGCVILLRPTQSLTMCLQQIGRGMRPKADGSALIVLDHAQNCVMHGLPTDEREWTLDGVEKNKDRVAPEPWACMACDALNSANRMECKECGAPKPWKCGAPDCRTRNHGHDTHCVACGMARPKRKELVADDAEMMEFNPAAVAHVARMSYGQFKAKKRTPAEIEAYRKAKGYKPGWAFYFRKDQIERFGHGWGVAA
jgi:superfamily II DNA or RNA helicase